MTWTGAASNIVLTVGDKAEYGSDGSSKAGQFDFVSVTVTLEGGEEDTRTATTIEFGDHATEGNVGDELPFPTVIVNDPTGAPVSDAFVVWESNDSDVATIGDGVIDSPTDVQKLILVMHEGGYYFYTGEGYLYASSSEKNYLRTEATPDANAKADIAFSEGEATIVFQGENTHNVLRFNPNNGSPIFSCYASTSKAGTLPLIYKEVEAPAAEPSIRIAETEITIEATADEGTIDVTYKNIRDEEMRNAMAAPMS